MFDDYCPENLSFGLVLNQHLWEKCLVSQSKKKRFRITAVSLSIVPGNSQPSLILQLNLQIIFVANWKMTSAKYYNNMDIYFEFAYILINYDCVTSKYQINMRSWINRKKKDE